jgi:hypothetical protein
LVKTKQLLCALIEATLIKENAQARLCVSVHNIMLKS